MKRTKLLILSSIIILFSCSEEVIPSNDCSQDLICTEEFRTLIFSPKENDQFKQLDTYYTLNLDNGNTYNYQDWNDQSGNEFYTIISDAEMNEIEKEGTNLRFIGIVGSTPAIEQDFVVGHDCCHIIPLEGPFEGF